ncbi:MAG: hypothetical protein HWN68_10810 [Desulfobacterales bacterium]|nr:hypothetical protein [Desulfobacterales bacterium]
MKEVKAMIIEQGRLTEYSLGTTDGMRLDITHNGKSLKLDKEEVLQKLFMERNWRGKPKRYYVFCRLNGGTPKLVGLEEFNPYNAISAEEADIMVHESVTMRGARNLVTKVKGVGGGSRKLMIFLIILIVIIGMVVMKYQGLI